MKQILRIVMVILTTMAAIASVVIFYNPENGRVLGIKNSGVLTNAIVVTNLLPPGHPTEWIFTNDVVRLMTPEEMVQRDMDADATNRMRILLQAKFRLTNDIVVISAVNVLLDLVNTNRLRDGLQAISDEEFIGLVHEEIDAH